MSLGAVERAKVHAQRLALDTPDGRFSYRDLIKASSRVAGRLLRARPDLNEARIAFLTAPSVHYVAAQWGIWRAGGVAVPLAVSHPAPEHQRVLRDATPECVLADAAFADAARAAAGALGIEVLTVERWDDGRDTLPAIDPSRRAMILYTSGTTGEPKGAVATHANLEAHMDGLVRAWGWSNLDRALLVLPLHHVHGIVNVLGCALWAGAVCEMVPAFDADAVWERIASGDITVFMAVPTIYQRLITAWEQLPSPLQRSSAEVARDVRLFVSGSAALPVTAFERWREITGHAILERYGTTETGMVLSNPLVGERRPGSVGMPLPGVQVRLVGERGELVRRGEPGEVQVRGPGVFREYWGRAEDTAAAFDHGWYRTGDVAAEADGRYRILGRQSIDIIKTGGYKVSALEIEEVLRTHPEITDCAVVGVPNPEWGEIVCVALEGPGEVSIDELRAWSKERLAPYKVPRALVRTVLPRNAMGKVNKRDVRDIFVTGGL